MHSRRRPRRVSYRSAWLLGRVSALRTPLLKLKRYGTVPAAEHSKVERPINELRSQAKTGRQRRKR